MTSAMAEFQSSTLSNGENGGLHSKSCRNLGSGSIRASLWPEFQCCWFEYLSRREPVKEKVKIRDAAGTPSRTLLQAPSYRFDSAVRFGLEFFSAGTSACLGNGTQRSHLQSGRTDQSHSQHLGV
jgi:hypothetical protein